MVSGVSANHRDVSSQLRGKTFFPPSLRFELTPRELRPPCHYTRASHCQKFTMPLSFLYTCMRVDTCRVKKVLGANVRSGPSRGCVRNCMQNHATKYAGMPVCRNVCM